MFEISLSAAREEWKFRRYIPSISKKDQWFQLFQWFQWFQFLFWLLLVCYLKVNNQLILRFVVIEMRNHFIRCLKEAHLHPFPAVTAKDTDKFDTRIKFTF